jgi:TorA maturation chaperone TorD
MWKNLRSEVLDELISANDNRQAVYSFLTRMYAVEISKETLNDLAEKTSLWTKLAGDPEVQGTEIAEGFKSLAEFTTTLKESERDKVLLELAAEYAGLFLGVRQMPPHPSESVYTSKERLIMQKARDEVLMIYRSMGLQRFDKFREPEDHIAIELQFMAEMCGKTSEALKNGKNAEAKKYLDVQRDFLNDHLAKWVPMFAADILKGAKREFYKAIAKITKGYVETDKEVVLEMIDKLSMPSAQADETEHAVNAENMSEKLV